VSQQTPSTQWLEPHSASAPHAAPFFFAHEPARCVLHASGAVHVATPQQTPSVQNPDEHCVFALHGLPRSAAGSHALLLHV
jgi:hypothetical protein